MAILHNMIRSQRICGPILALLLAALLSGCGGDPPRASKATDRPTSREPNRERSSPTPSHQESSRRTAAAAPRPPAVVAAEPGMGGHRAVETSALPAQFRPSDTRPRHNDARLAEQGIRVYESQRLKLYTDIEPDIAQTLPPVIDQAYLAWEAYFGPLPPDRERTEFQMTGYLMRDQPLFRRAGLIPADLREFVHGRHRGAEFWMNDQPFDYYRRHLMIHEATHCFMTALHNDADWPPTWYTEGMAEHFGTHALIDDADATPSRNPVSGRDRVSAPAVEYTFRVLPHDRDAFAGLGRISLIRDAVAAGDFRTLDEVFELAPDDYLRNDAYAWSWAVCCWLDTHPRYRERFHELGRHLSRRDFLRTFDEQFGDDLPEMRVEWTIFAHALGEGFDVERAAIEFTEGRALAEGAAATVDIAANRGWQSSGVRVEQGRRYEVTAEGQFTLARAPKPWVAEPQGISFRYVGGRPLGQLLGAVHADGDVHGLRMVEIIPLGSHGQFTAAATGTLYLRLNDDWAELADNDGQATVEVRAVAIDATPTEPTN